MATKGKSTGPFTVVPSKHAPGEDIHVARDREYSLDKLLSNPGNDVVDPEKRKIGTWNPELHLLLTARMRELMDIWNRVPLREEALVNLAKKAHPEYTPVELFEYTRRDASSDQVILRRVLKVDEYLSERSSELSKEAGERSERVKDNIRRIRQGQAQPEPPVAPAPTPYAQPKPMNTIPAVVIGPTGTFRVLVQEVIFTDQVLVMIQETDNQFSFWEPPLDDSIHWTISYAGQSAVCSYSGISYAVVSTGSTHFIFLITG